MNDQINDVNKTSDTCALLDGVIDIATDAGRRIVEVYNQENELVMSLRVVNLILRRNAA